MWQRKLSLVSYTCCKLGDSLKKWLKGSPSCRPLLSVRTSVRYLLSATKVLLVFHSICCRHSIKTATVRAGVWRLWTLERAFCCNDIHRDMLWHFGNKMAYVNWRRAPLAVLLHSIFTASSAVGCTAGLPLLAGDKFLGKFAKFQKTTISFMVSVCLSAWNNWAATGRISIKFDILGFFGNLSRKFTFH